MLLTETEHLMLLVTQKWQTISDKIWKKILDCYCIHLHSS
jgi:hypothetical protein